MHSQRYVQFARLKEDKRLAAEWLKTEVLHYGSKKKKKKNHTHTHTHIYIYVHIHIYTH